MQKLDLIGECLPSRSYPGRERGLMQWPEHVDFSLEFIRLLDAIHGDASTAKDCFATVDRITPGDAESWYREWHATAELSKVRAEYAELSRARAEQEDSVSRRRAAGVSWLRASNYFRGAQVFLGVADARRQEAVKQMRYCARQYLKHLEPTGEILRLDDEDFGPAEGYLIRPIVALDGAPLAICVGGWEDFKEDHLIRLRKAALERGISLLLIDLPKPARPMTVRSERLFAASIISLWMDYLGGRPDLAQGNIAIFGVGLGASIATEAATLDSRFSAAVCDGGRLDAAVKAFSMRQVRGSDDGSGAINAYADQMQGYSQLKRIQCPVLVTHHDSSWPDAACVYQADTASAKAHLASGKVVTEPPLSPPVLYERIFDWMTDCLCPVSRP